MNHEARVSTSIGTYFGRRYWRSTDELADTPEFREWLEREFPSSAAQLNGDEWSRRSFLKLMGASVALAGFGVSSCRRPELHLVPFTKTVEWTIPGKFLYYSTAMPRRNGAIPLLVTTVDGRPIKLDGNPLHPASNGASDVFVQAAINELYNPLRAKRIAENGKTIRPRPRLKNIWAICARKSGTVRRFGVSG